MRRIGRREKGKREGERERKEGMGERRGGGRVRRR